MKWILAVGTALVIIALAVVLVIRSQILTIIPMPDLPVRTEPTKGPIVAPAYPVPVPASTEEEESPNQPLTVVPPIADAPKADAKNSHKPLLPDKSLILETAPGDDGKPKPVRILLECDVCMRRGPLEVLLCRKNTKEHEAVIRTAVDAKLIHAALIALGAKVGAPVQFIDPKTEQEAYKPASGETIALTLHYKHAGKLHSHPAQEWIRDTKTKKPMAQSWVFAGSRFVKDPDQPEKPAYYTANNGEIVGISNFIDSMLDIPVNVGSDNANLSFDANTAKIPPVLTKVWLILEIGKPRAVAP